MERRTAARMIVDLPAWCLLDGHRHTCRAIDLSPTGMLLERGRALTLRDPPHLGAYEVHLEGSRPIRVRARAVRVEGRMLAVRFVVMNDVDRLTIAEHADSLPPSSGLLH
jgi:PilZ domain